MASAEPIASASAAASGTAPAPASERLIRHQQKLNAKLASHERVIATHIRDSQALARAAILSCTPLIDELIAVVLLYAGAHQFVHPSVILTEWVVPPLKQLINLKLTPAGADTDTDADGEAAASASAKESDPKPKSKSRPPPPQALKSGAMSGGRSGGSRASGDVLPLQFHIDTYAGRVPTEVTIGATDERAGAARASVERLNAGSDALQLWRDAAKQYWRVQLPASTNATAAVAAAAAAAANPVFTGRVDYTPVIECADRWLEVLCSDRDLMTHATAAGAAADTKSDTAALQFSRAAVPNAGFDRMLLIQFNRAPAPVPTPASDDTPAAAAAPVLVKSLSGFAAYANSKQHIRLSFFLAATGFRK